MSDNQFNLLTNLHCAAILFAMMVGIGMSVTFADVIGVSRIGRLIPGPQSRDYDQALQKLKGA